VPVHLQQAYASLGHERGAFPVSEEIAQEFLSLPMFPELAEAQIDYVIETVAEIVNSGVMA
jgi:dTDP-4-amino-4,6-dideoxygalactose transaminase